MSVVRPVWTARCDGIARAATHDLFLPGGEHEDLVQEARIGVMDAIEAWQPGGMAFELFAFHVARRRTMDAITAANRMKRRVLNDAASLDKPVGQGEEPDGTLGEMLLFSEAADPLRIVIARESLRELLAAMRCLSAWERECVQRCHLLGEPYGAVGQAKSVDNAIQRAKRKLPRAA